MNQILEAREERKKHIEELMDQHPNKTIIILKTNVVGENKNPKHLKFICTFFHSIIYNTFLNKVITSGYQYSEDGNYCYFVVDEVGTMVKIRTIDIEESTPLGRLIDLDVYNKKSISRQDLSCEMRKCLICDNYAHICVRNKTHSQEELSEKIKEIIVAFLTQYLTNKTIQAIYSELELYPKFGLVSHKDSGCHKDMNYETFVKSTFAIKKYISEFINEGFQLDIDPMKLQEIGIRAERKMFQVTNEVNTQKGLIFLLGIFLPSIAKTIFLNETTTFLKAQIQSIAKTVIGDYYETVTDKNVLSNGDKIFLEYGLKGIRGEALTGLDLIFNIPSYHNSQDDIKFHNYLIHLMSELNDTNIIHRTNIETLNEVKDTMKKIIQTGGYESNKEEVHSLSNKYITKNISPGGSADMLVIKILYEELKHLIKYKSEEL